MRGTRPQFGGTTLITKDGGVVVYRLRLAAESESASTPSPWAASMDFLMPESAILKMFTMSLYQLDP